MMRFQIGNQVVEVVENMKKGCKINIFKKITKNSLLKKLLSLFIFLDLVGAKYW